jgi:hypothetical protein
MMVVVEEVLAALVVLPPRVIGGLLLLLFLLAIPVSFVESWQGQVVHDLALAPHEHKHFRRRRSRAHHPSTRGYHALLEEQG